MSHSGNAPNDISQFQIPNSSYLEIVEDEVPSYETSQFEQFQNQIQSQSQVSSHHLHRNSSSSNIIQNRFPRNSSVHSLQEASQQHRSSLELSKALNEERRNIKRVGLQFLTARQLFGLALGRDLSLLAIIRDLYVVMKEWYRLSHENPQLLNSSSDIVVPTGTTPTPTLVTSARSSELLMAALWCVVSGYFTYQILDSLMLRWIIIYSPSAVIMRMISMSMFIVMIIHLLTKAFNPDGNYYLHVWILISCALTGIYIFQSFVTSNLSIDNYNSNELDDAKFNLHQQDGIINITKKKKKKKNARFIDLYNIAVFAVVPIGVASFITMIGLIRNLLILKLDVESMLNRYSGI